ncbi:4-hydroxybutyrate CoA-transferase [candidate division KSB1 bacterium]|nr:acetyl-CoA hydrolase/transferase family protein [bacterium]OQX59369.1 MAG: 4-hydroxybutyrate CoA-transferase [candidate division KSB1 bacterium 4484_219]RKY93166.1 MAG: 4-hydroxybutyrate CoA-transferase [candidate division KSB1 bacterium]
MKWIYSYRSKIVSAEEAVSVVKSGDRVFVSGNAATPYVLLHALAERKDELRNVEIVHVLLLGDGPLAQPEMEGHFRHRSLFVGSADRDAVNEGRADYVPIFLHEVPALFTSGALPVDVAIIHTAPPDEHGFLSYGVEVLATKAVVENAKTVIAQVNEKMPRVLGDSFVHISRIDKIVEVSEDLPELKLDEFSEVEKQIGFHIANLIEDGATLQLGIGGIPNATLFFVKDKKDLGIHTEMCSDGIMEAIEAGIVTGAKKTLHPGKVIATFVLGTSKLYDYVDDNPILEVHPTEYTNDPFIIAQNEKMVAINSALEVDLTGQVCSDSMGYHIYSGFGGQVDFIRGAARSKGGKPIIALPSTAKGDTISRIVSHLKEGAGVVTSRGDVHYVVTEHGVAYLHGKSRRERAEALIQIAHPKFRDELMQFAKEKHYL